MIEKTVELDGKTVKLRSSALLPKLYRHDFGRDMVKDMRQLTKAYQKVKNLPKDATEEEREDAQYSVLDLDIFANVSWLMLKYAGEKVGSSPDEWLESLNGAFSIYEILPAVLELWAKNNKTTSVPRKK